jgi:PEP-CTERM motif
MFGFTRALGRTLILAGCVALTGLQSASASTITLNSTSFGWWDSLGTHDASNTNYGTGDSAQNVDHRSFFVFNLSGVSGTVVSAALNIFNSAYSSADPSETLGIFDVSTPIAVLIATGTGQIPIYDDLGSGTLFGSTTVSPANNNANVTITLNSVALAALQSGLGSDFAFGGALTTLSRPNLTEGVFTFSNNFTGTRQLVVTTVPEPASLALFASGLTAIAVARRRRNGSAPQNGPPAESRRDGRWVAGAWFAPVFEVEEAKGGK